jgi:hypothetical protein
METIALLALVILAINLAFVAARTRVALRRAEVPIGADRRARR